MMKRSLLLSLALLCAALLLLSACGENKQPSEDSSDTTNVTETEPPVTTDRLVDKYDADVNALTNVPGTFTDRMTAEQFTEALKMGQSVTAPPLLYNLIQVMGLTKDDITLYSEMNGGLLDAALIDGLFLEGEAMREALRADYTIMAGGYPYTVFELAHMTEAELAALAIPEDDLKTYLATIRPAAEATGEQLDYEVEALIEKYTG